MYGYIHGRRQDKLYLRDNIIGFYQRNKKPYSYVRDQVKILEKKLKLKLYSQEQHHTTYATFKSFNLSEIVKLPKIVTSSNYIKELLN